MKTELDWQNRLNPRFVKHLHTLQPTLERLLSVPSFKVTALPKDMPASGVYLFSENGRHLYVGRTRNLRRRLKDHCRGDRNTASFAFLLARKKTGNLRRRAYTSDGSCAYLMRQGSFRTVFFAQVERVKQMDVRFVKERHPIGKRSWNCMLRAC